jgi:hypothetical protein
MAGGFIVLNRRYLVALAAFGSIGPGAGAALAQDKSIVVASTTSSARKRR